MSSYVSGIEKGTKTVSSFVFPLYVISNIFLLHNPIAYYKIYICLYAGNSKCIQGCISSMIIFFDGLLFFGIKSY